MKKIWVLEGFIDRSQMIKSLDDLYSMKAGLDSDDAKKACDDAIIAYKKRIDSSHDGYWFGYEGKSSYRDFCICAKRVLKNMRKENMAWRVIEGIIPDDAKSWLDYKIVKENVGVMKYLWATL